MAAVIHTEAAALRRAAVRATLAPSVHNTQPWRFVLESLTEREREVLELMAEGLTNKQIGERLFLAEKTVKNYVSGLLAKLGPRSRTQAAVYGVEHGLG
jgi:DNA-binding NarL/FixJ family response regulator